MSPNVATHSTGPFSFFRVQSEVAGQYAKYAIVYVHRSLSLTIQRIVNLDRQHSESVDDVHGTDIVIMDCYRFGHCGDTTFRTLKG